MRTVPEFSLTLFTFWHSNCYVQHLCSICIYLRSLCFVLSLCQWETISRWQLLQLMWRSWWGRRRREGIAPTNLEKHESCSVMPFQHARAVQPLIEDFFLIINLHVYDLLIKFVSTPGKLVGCTHNNCVAPAQTIQNEILCFSLTWIKSFSCALLVYVFLFYQAVTLCTSRSTCASQGVLFSRRKLLLMSLVAVKNGTDDVTLLSDWLLFSVLTL